MNFIIAIVSFLIILAACNSTTDKTSFGPANDLIAQFKPMLNGVWVPADYMDDIVKTKSPFKSSEKLTFISELVIDTSGIQADSMRVGIALGNHEGSDFILYFKQGKAQTSLLTSITDFEPVANSYELGYRITGLDTALTIYHYDKTQKLLDKTNYVRVNAAAVGSTLEGGFQYMVNKKLITGSYEVTDSAGTLRSVTLTNEGVVSGLPGFNTYYVITDFVGSPEDTTDKICFDIQTAQQHCYTFEINDDTIHLFTTPQNETDTLTKKGSPIYKFVKQY